MIAVDEEDLICDFAETYQIYNYRELPAKLVATLAVGLRASSRIKLKLSNSPIDLNTTLLASIVDKLSIIIWSKTNDGAKGINKPKMLLELLNRDMRSDGIGFDSAEEFENARLKIINGGNYVD